VYLVVPGVCGIAVWSPQLDENRNSMRGLQVARELAKRFKLNPFDIYKFDLQKCKN
jgi:glutaminase